MNDWIAWMFYWYNVGKQIAVETSFLSLEICSVLVSLSSFANTEIGLNMNKYSYDALLYGKVMHLHTIVNTLLQVTIVSKNSLLMVSLKK